MSVAKDIEDQHDLIFKAFEKILIDYKIDHRFVEVMRMETRDLDDQIAAVEKDLEIEITSLQKAQAKLKKAQTAFSKDERKRSPKDRAERSRNVIEI